MSKLKKIRIGIRKAIVSKIHQHRIAERALKKEIAGAQGHAKKISRKQAMAAFSGQLLTDHDFKSQDPIHTHVDIPDIAGFHGLMKRISKKRMER